MSLILSSAPHIRTGNTTTRLMGNVLIALAPCVAAGIYFFGLRAALVLAVSTASAVLAEFVWQKLAHQKIRISDCSAAVTGLLIGLIVSPTVPWWAVMIGSFFAIIVVKQLFGGIGDNFLNPALAARAVLLASWPARLTSHPAVGFNNVDAVTAATPLAGKASLYDLLIGNVGGAIGETCKIAILLGLIYLLVSRTISWRIPFFTIASAFLFKLILSGSPVDSLTCILSGGLLFGAVYMATDYATSPMQSYAQVIYSVLIGVMTVVIREWGAYPEGVTYAILIANIVAPLLDRFIPQKIYGVTGKKKEVKA